MPDNPLPLHQTISLSAAQRHDRLCDEFEKAWNEGNKPRIEDFLKQVPIDEQPALLCSLARVEKDLREDDEILDDFRFGCEWGPLREFIDGRNVRRDPGRRQFAMVKWIRRDQCSEEGPQSLKLTRSYRWSIQKPADYFLAQRPGAVDDGVGVITADAADLGFTGAGAGL